MTDTNTAEREALMKLVDAYAEASFDQGLHQRTEDDAPEAARKKLEKALRDALAGRASLAVSAGSEPVAQLAAERDELFQAAIDFIRTLTGMEPPPIEVAPPEVFAPFREFVNTVQTITDKRHHSPPEGMVAVPKDFIRAFSDTAHNYQLSVEPPDHFSGTEGDAFRAAYARCGVELLRLRGILIGPLPASEAKEL